VNFHFPGIDTSAMAEPHRDLTTPLPAELADQAASTAVLPLGTALPQPGESTRISTGPAVGPGTVLRHRYVLERELGRGGMGTVYRALDRNKQGLTPQHRHVAVKVLREELARLPDALQALRREAHQAQSLSHPCIVNVFDFDHDGDVYFITMELLEGELLSDLIQRIRPGKLAREAAIGILRDLGNAVAFAHSRGVLHMDLKPGNVMITTQGEVRVLDLGLAHPHMTEPWISDHPPPFHAATPTYASCEQLDGAAADARDDVFSFACVAYELLSGEHPFGRSSAREAREQGRRPRRIRGLSRREWRALRQGLAWTREDRQRSLGDLLEGLGLTATAERAQHRQRIERPAAGPGHSRWWLTTAGLAILAVGLYVAWVRLAPDGGGDSLAGFMRNDSARPTQREESPPAAAATATDSTSADPVPAEPVPVDPVLADSLATSEDLILPDVADFIALTPAPTPVITAAGPGRLGFASDTITVSESARVAPLRVVRRGGAEGTVSFRWRTIDDSAVADRDYAALGTVWESIGPGETSKTLLIPIVSDSIAESTELFDVVIEDPTAGATLGAITRITVIIVDDD
jgi:serine/threonine protein kinase